MEKFSHKYWPIYRKYIKSWNLQSGSLPIGSPAELQRTKINLWTIMPNGIKYSASAETRALKKNNFWIGTGDVDKAPTQVTGYWASITPPVGGYSVYINRPSGGPESTIQQTIPSWSRSPEISQEPHLPQDLLHSTGTTPRRTTCAWTSTTLKFQQMD